MVGAGRPFVVAHRAANSVEGVRAAARTGARLLECDVHRFWGRLEVRHLKTVGPLPILWDRWFLANPFGPRLLLAELLRATPVGAELMLDLKGVRATIGAHVRRELVAFGRPITVCSRNWAALEPLRGLTGVRRVYSVGSRRQLGRLLDRFGPRSLDGVSIHAKLLTPQVVQELRVRTDTVMSWPITDQSQAERLVAWGVRGLITESPERIGIP